MPKYKATPFTPTWVLTEKTQKIWNMQKNINTVYTATYTKVFTEILSEKEVLRYVVTIHYKMTCP